MRGGGQPVEQDKAGHDESIRGSATPMESGRALTPTITMRATRATRKRVWSTLDGFNRTCTTPVATRYTATEMETAHPAVVGDTPLPRRVLSTATSRPAPNALPQHDEGEQPVPLADVPRMPGRPSPAMFCPGGDEHLGQREDAEDDVGRFMGSAESDHPADLHQRLGGGIRRAVEEELQRSGGSVGFVGVPAPPSAAVGLSPCIRPGPDLRRSMNDNPVNDRSPPSELEGLLS
jgi:hypothetical protein